MLERFATDNELNRLVEEYIIEHLKNAIINKVLKKESIIGYSEALEIIQNSLSELRNQHKPKEKKEYSSK